VNNTNHGEPEIYAHETKYPTMSFNTIEEVATIQREINLLWKQTHPQS